MIVGFFNLEKISQNKFRKDKKEKVFYEYHSKFLATIRVKTKEVTNYCWCIKTHT